MTKVIFQVAAEQSPMTFGPKTQQVLLPRKRYVPALYSGLGVCTYCGSSKPKDEAKEDNGKVSLVCPDCQMDVVE